MLIGLIGKAGAGKDATFHIAAEMAKQYGLPEAERLAFADPLKHFTAAVLGISVQQLEDMKRDRRWRLSLGRTFRFLPFISSSLREFTIRHVLQRVGTEGGRNVFGEDFWVDRALPENFDHSERLVFITDMRFWNEARRVTQLGGVVVKVVGPDAETGGHASETELEQIEPSYVIDNSVRDDDWYTLRESVAKLMIALKTEAQFTGVLDREVGEGRHLQVMDDEQG